MPRHRFSAVSLVAVLSLLMVLIFSASACAPTIVKPLPAAPPGMVNSVLGPISPDQMGQTLVPEHFVLAYPGWYGDETLAPYNREAALQANLDVIKTAKAMGINTIIDATTNDVGGRDPEHRD